VFNRQQRQPGNSTHWAKGGCLHLPSQVPCSHLHSQRWAWPDAARPRRPNSTAKWTASCAIDGGVHIYETVALPKDYFGPDGELASPYKGRMGTDARYGPEYQSTLTKAYLVSGNPSLTRTVWRLVRKADGKVLGEAIIYSRADGDLPGPSAPSGHTCPKPPADINIERRVFVEQAN